MFTLKQQHKCPQVLESSPYFLVSTVTESNYRLKLWAPDGKEARNCILATANWTVWKNPYILRSFYICLETQLEIMFILEMFESHLGYRVDFMPWVLFFSVKPNLNSHILNHDLFPLVRDHSAKGHTDRDTTSKTQNKKNNFTVLTNSTYILAD